MTMKLKRAVRALAAGSVIVGGLVLGVAGAAGAWSNAVTAHAIASTECGSYTATLTVTGTGADGSHTAVPVYTAELSTSPYSTVTPTSVVPNTSTISSANGVSTVVVFTFPASDAGKSLVLAASVGGAVPNGWPGDSNYYTYSAAPVTLPIGCPPPPPVAPTVHLTATASTSCGDFTVPVSVAVGSGSNLVGNDGQTTVTFGTPVSPSTLVISPGASGSTSAVFPSSDAGTTQEILGVVNQVGFEGTSSVSVDVTLPAVCTTTVTVPTPGPTTTVTVPGPTQIVTVPCYGTLPAPTADMGTYGGACPVPGINTPATPAAPAATPAPAAPATAAVVPVGAPQTGFGGAAQSSSDDFFLYSGGGLLLIGLLTGLILFTTRKRDA